jgi:hypothetical protein
VLVLIQITPKTAIALVSLLAALQFPKSIQNAPPDAGKPAAVSSKVPQTRVPAVHKLNLPPVVDL